MMKVSAHELAEMGRKLKSAQSRANSALDRAEKIVEGVVHTAEVGSMAFAMGVVQGRTGGVEVIGVPLELGIGVALHTFGWIGDWSGRGVLSGHLHGFGDGALAAYLTTLGRGAGIKWAQKSTGALPGGGGGLFPGIPGIPTPPAPPPP